LSGYGGEKINSRHKSGKIDQFYPFLPSFCLLFAGLLYPARMQRNHEPGSISGPQSHTETAKKYDVRVLDEQEKLIVRQLIRDPRESDNGIGEATGVNVRTVSRKRQRLEEEGVISYYTHVDFSQHGMRQFGSKHLYIIKFRLGITIRQILEDIRREPKVRSVFTEMIEESHVAEIDGKTALLLFVEGVTEVDIVQTVQEKLIPSLLANHGENSIEEVSTVRVLAPIRRLRNYLPGVNMENGYMKKDWPNDALYVGQ
jgi:DNA-binding Lrp family transcriptional regulator